MSTSNDSADQGLFEELRELAEGYGLPGDALEETLVTFWKNPKAASVRERLRLRGVSDDRINREAFRKVLRRGRLRELVLELEGIARNFKDAAIVVTYGDGRGHFVQADQTDKFGGFQLVLQQLLHDMDAGGLPLGIVGVAADGLVCTRPIKEFADKASVLAILEKAAANISRQNPPASAN
jgi:hypothetical protein